MEARQNGWWLLKDIHHFIIGLLKDYHLTLKEWEYLVHHTKKKVLYKFLFAMLIILSYAWYVIARFGGREGIVVTLLTWSFFVFCTPIADAGILLDFPMRLFTNIRMIRSEVFVWILAATINVLALAGSAEVYKKTIILQLLQHILTRPWPYWSIIILCAAGTFLSVVFADELVDVAEEHHRHIHHKHSHKWEFIAMCAVVLLVIIIYEFLLRGLGISLPLF